MYLSKVHLRHWRAYSEATFQFEKPRLNKPITLIGAGNGHGKTSLLMALYLGLFGKYGLSSCEGFRKAGSSADVALKSMRAAMPKFFRRKGVPTDEPTQIELVFTDAKPGSCDEIRVIRRWHFYQNNKLKGNEDIEIHLANDAHPGGQLLNYRDLDEAHFKLQQMLFPSYLTPAFFFDGEQAADLIGSSGGLQKAVNVMFGEELTQKTVVELKRFSSNISKSGGSKQKAKKMEDECAILASKINHLNKEQGQLQQKREELEKATISKENKRDEIQRKISLLGGQGRNIAQLTYEIKNAGKKETEARNALRDSLSHAGLALAIGRFKDTILKQLNDEHLLEEWERFKETMISHKEAVISRVLPEPQTEDTLLCNMASNVREQLKQRIISAFEAIYNRPKPQMAEHYILGHVKGEDRERIRNGIEKAAAEQAGILRQRARDYRKATDEWYNANNLLRIEKNRPDELNSLVAKLEELNENIHNDGIRLGGLNSQIDSKKSEVDGYNRRHGEILEKLKDIEPSLKRLAIAERARRVLSTFTQDLTTICAERLRAVVNEHFKEIADERFKDFDVELSVGKSPILKWEKEDGEMEVLHLESGSGFERRSFSIAFCLALAEITRRRIPLVIDTPVGNADAKYRRRALRSLAEFKHTDQIIILTHDEEVRGPFLEAIEDRVNQKMLIEFDKKTGKSQIHNDKFFDFNR